MPNIEFAQTEPISAQSIWPDEAQHFTPWLACNLNLLGAALGCDLRLIETEHSVGPLRLDVLAEGNGYYHVAIENQYGLSDQGHFGQIITKGAGSGAAAWVWVAERFSREHLLAVNHLNSVMGPAQAVFAVRIEPFKIGDSACTLRFHVEAHPHGWLPLSGEEFEPRVLRGHGFFEGICIESGDDQMTSGPSTNRSFGSFSPYIDWDSGVSYTLVFMGNDNNKGTSVHLWIETESTAANLAIFRHLERHKLEIHEELGHSLTWEPSGPGRSEACAIRWKTKEGSIDAPPLELAQTRAGMLDRYQKLRAALDKRLPAAIAAAGL